MLARVISSFPIRLSMVDGAGYTMQIAEGWTAMLPEEVNKTLLS